METCSNQNLWKILIGHSSVRDPDLIFKEVCAKSKPLKEGLAYYREPCKAAEERLRRKNIKKAKLQLVLEISKHLHLEQELSFELFVGFLADNYQLASAELGRRLTKEKEQQKLLSQLWKYYMSERRHLLRCIKHLFGYWQDSSHTYRETYGKCVDVLEASKLGFIEKILEQYVKCANSEIPASLKSEAEQDAWLMANLREQCELLEIVLLYHKDYFHPLPALLKAAKSFQALGFGMQFHSRLGLMPAAKVLVTHISHLCCLIIVEAMDLEFLLSHQEQPSKFNLRDYVMLDGNFQSEFQELDCMLSEWGDVQHHAPILLAWTVLKSVVHPDKNMEGTRLLGNRALQADVFGYLREMLDSPFFSGDRPVSNICKSVVQVLLANCITYFSENSLGDPKTLIAIATKSLSHPRLCLEFWYKGLEKGVGILLSSALKKFPLDLTSVLRFLEPLAREEISAGNVFQLLRRVQHYTDDFTHISASNIDVGTEAGSWLITKPLSLYPRESTHPDLLSFVLPVGTEGVVLTPVDEIDSRQIISWQAVYSAWDLFGLITCSILYSPGIGVDPTPSSLVEGVAAIARMVTQVLKHDWSLEEYLRPITSLYFTLLHKYSSLPHPPCLLLAECLQCIAVMAKKQPLKVWERLSHTGFLPHINFAPSSIEMISVAPGHYGHLMNSWERPRGIYPVSMAMLDLLLSGLPPEGCPSLGDALACVVLVMREMFAGSHSWRYRHSTNRDQIGHKLLQLCRMILSTPQGKTNKGYSVVEFVQHFLLHSVGSHSLLSTLSLSLDTVNALYSSRLSVSGPVLQVEALKIAFQVIDILLKNKKDTSPTPLEQALATQSVKRKLESHSVPTPVHLVAVIASYIHHHDDPHVPAGATRLLSRLSQVAPMSVFACLGSEAPGIRDAFMHRLRSHVEDVELKVVILELVTECVSSQPGMMELFLKIQPAPTDSAPGTKAAYVLGQESCLHTVNEFINCKKRTPPPLLRASLFLLRSLWAGRHDAALIALRAHSDFWKNLTHPLLKSSSSCSGDEAVDFPTCAHIMFIVALEVYYILEDKMDTSLVQFFDEFSSKGCYQWWMKQLCAAPGAESAVEGQLQLSRAWSTLLCVGASQEQLFHLSDASLRTSLLEGLLIAIASHLAPPTSHQSESEPSDSTPPPPPLPPTSATQGVGVLVAEELSVLSVVLTRKWAESSLQLGPMAVQLLVDILSACGRLEMGVASNILVSVYSCVVQLLSARHSALREPLAKATNLLDLVPFFEETFKSHSFYLRMDSKQRPDIVAVYALNELCKSVQASPSPSAADLALYLEVLRQHSIISMLGMLLGEHLHLATDLEFVTAVFGLFISLSNFKSGGEALLMNRISHHINISLANTLSLKRKEWAGMWQLSLQLMCNLLDCLSHQFLDHALDFVGVYQERLLLALDIYQVMVDLSSVEETLNVCRFLFQLSLYRQQWHFTMPALHSDLLQRLVCLTSSAAALVSSRSSLKQIVKTLNAAGLLAPEDGPLGGEGGVATKREESSSPRPTLSWMHEDKTERDDAWVTTSPAYTKLQDGLISILTSCLATLRHYCPPLNPMILEGGVDLVEYSPLFSLSLAPPTIQVTTPPSLATLTTCLSAGVDLLNKLDPPRVGTPSRSPTKSPSMPRSAASAQKRAEYLCFLEQVVVVLLSQATRYLVDPATPTHDKLQLKKELANELSYFSADLLRNFTRKGAPSPVRTRLSIPSQDHTHPHPHPMDSFSSLGGKGGSLGFSTSSDQAIFKLADAFSKQFFR